MNRKIQTEQENIQKEIARLSGILQSNRLTMPLCRQISALVDRQIALTGKKNLSHIYIQIGSQLGLQQIRAVKEIRTVVNACDKLRLGDTDKRCINKVFAENSVSMVGKIVSSLDYIPLKDKHLYLENKLSATQMYERRKTYPVVCANQTLEERAKRLKDDSEIPLTVDMIIGTFQGATNNYLESVLMYIDMVEQVKEKTHDGSDLISQIITAMEMVNQVITSFKEAVINNSMY